MKIIDNTPIENFDVDWGDPDGTGMKEKSKEQVQKFIKKKFIGLGYTFLGNATPSTVPATITIEDKFLYIATEEGNYSNFGLGEITDMSVIKSVEGSWRVEGLGVAFIDFVELKYDKTPHNLGIGTISGNWTSVEDQKHVVVPLLKGNTRIKLRPKENKCVSFAFLKTYTEPVSGERPDYATSSCVSVAKRETLVTVPDDANYLILGVYNVPTTEIILDYPTLYGNANAVEELKSAVESTSQYLAEAEIISEIRNLEWKNLGIGGLSGNWTDYDNKKHIVYHIYGVSEITITPNASSTPVVVAFLKSYDTPVPDSRPDYADGTECLLLTSESVIKVPVGARYMTINVYDSGISGNYTMPSSLRIKGIVPAMYEQRPKIVKTNTLYYDTVLINPNNLGVNWDSSDNEDLQNSVLSGFGYKLPDSYTQDGNPTKVCFVLHGYSGYVSPSTLGYDRYEWKELQQKFLDAGFLILDINGYGEYSVNSPNNDHWGCQQAVFTLKKAFEFIKRNYNVESKASVYGYSMGGALAYSYAMNFPQDVDLIALHEPSSVTNHEFVVPEAYASIANRYGYNTYQDAVDDDFKNFIGYALPLTFKRFSSDGKIIRKGMINLNLGSEILDGSYLVGSFSLPLRIWQGTIGDVVPYWINKNIINALRNGGSNASIRIMPNLNHTDIINSAIVHEETVSYLKRVL